MSSDADRAQVSRQQSSARWEPVGRQRARGEAEVDAVRAPFLVGTGHDPAHVASTLARADGASRARLTLRLQRERGNAYVQRVMGQVQGSVARRQDRSAVQQAPAGVVQRHVTEGPAGTIGGPGEFLQGGGASGRYMFTVHGGWIDRDHLAAHIERANRVVDPTLSPVQEPAPFMGIQRPAWAIGAAGLMSIPPPAAAGESGGRPRPEAGETGIQRAVVQRLPPASVPAPGSPAPATATSTAPAATPGALTRAQFDQVMAQRFAVGRIFTATFEDQVAGLARSGTAPPAGLARDTWRPWDPGSSSPVYRWIVSAFDQFESRIGGIPPVAEIGFYDTCYELDGAGRAVVNGDVAADFGGGRMAIYSAATSPTKRRPLPIGRSTSGPPAETPSVAITTRGSSPGAPLPLPTEEQDVLRTITHELGHGLVEAALTPRAGGPPADPHMLADYRREVGWTAGSAPRLYDAGEETVRSALAGGTPPPAAYRITEDNWNDPRWREQPLGLYMVSAPHEDFPEAVMAYVNAPDVLLARSPRRYQFLASRRERWLPYLLRTRPRGDFPEAAPNRRLA